MLGTGEFASSASESTSPSCTSSSCSVGTYCSQMGSPGDLMRSTIAGEMRNSKFSAACRRRAMSPTCSAPKRAAKASSDAMLLLRSSACQVSRCQILGIDHQVVTGCIVARDGRGSGVAACFVKPPRPLVVGARRGLHDNQSCVVRRESVFNFCEQLGPDSRALMTAIHDDPIEVVSRVCPRRRTPARVSHELIAFECTDELIVGVPSQTLIEQLDRGGDLLLAEEPGAPRQLLKLCAVRAPDGAQETQRAAHARPWRLAPPAMPARRCDGSARHSPTRRPSPSVRGPRRR